MTELRRQSETSGGMVAKAGPSDALIESILSLEFPLKIYWESLRVTAAALNKPEPLESRQVGHRRAELLLLSLDELSLRHAELKERQQQQEKARAAAEEAGRFYNRADSRANFDLWLKADFWTFDDALALLLGKNPKVVTWAAVSQAVNPKGFFSGAPVKSQFLTAYMTLRDLALRSDVMTNGQRLRPSEVVAWATTRVGLRLSEPLRALLSASQSPGAQASLSTPVPSQEALPAPQPTSASDEKSVEVKGAALRVLRHRWPSVESDLRHADRNGLAEAARGSGRGMWQEQAALEWARRNGKLKEGQPHSGLADFPRRIVRSDG